MQFTGADLILLGVFAIVLIVYRQLDRNNRSLDKVKRYASRIQDDLDAIVQEKIVAIRDMGIELEVHQKAAKEVLKRVQQIESGLDDRANEVDAIGSRINEYDSALAELMAMTERAQENIGRVKDESAYVDGVGRRIKQSQEKLDVVERSVATLIEQFGELNEKRLKDAQARAYKDAEAHAADIDARVNEVSERVTEFDEFVRSVEERGRQIAEQTDTQMQASYDELSRGAEQTAAHLRQVAQESVEQMESTEVAYQKRLLELAERGERLETAALAKLTEHIESRARASTQELTERVRSEHQRVVELHEQLSGQAEAERTGLMEQLEGFSAQIGERVGALRDRVTQSEAELQQRAEDLEQRRREIDRKIGAFGSDLVAKIATASEELEAKVLTEVEGRLGEYEGQISYRLEKIEGVGGDLDELEARLRQSMENTVSRVKDDFATFVEEFGRSRETQRQGVADEMNELRNQMGDLEEGLNELKTRAYENVSEKLKVFEDEFFADIKERGIALEQRLVDWQAEYQQRLDALAGEARADRERIESDYADELRNRLDSLQAKTYGQFEKFQEEVIAFQEDIRQRTAAAEQAVSAMHQELGQEVEQLAERSRAAFAQEFAHHDEAVRGELSQVDSAIRADIDMLGKEMTDGVESLRGELEQSRSESALWRTQVEQQMRSVEGEIHQQLADFRVRVAQNTSELRESFENDKNELIAGNEREREALRQELDGLADQVDRLTADLSQRTNEAITALSERYQELVLDSDRHTKEVAGDIDERVRDFRSFVQDTREQFNAMRERLFGKLTEDTQLLTVNLNEIDKRRRNFVEQTKIFERADSLRTELQQQVTQLRGDLERVEEKRKDVRDIEAQFAKLRKAADDVSERMNRFLSEKRRVDGLENDYKKLMSLSQAVELKLEHVTSSNDALQAIQAALRNVEQLEKDVETRFQRLEKKQGILDLTTEGVDKNFQGLQEIETKLRQIDASLNELPPQVEELQVRIKQLAGNKRDADAAVKQLAMLDETMGGIEERMEQLNSAREWLARTETRLEEVRNEAEEQVRLLGAIMKQERAPGRKEEGAPPLTTRETVIKLARQSWNVDEIARATSLSRGEVELILELSAK